MLQRLTELWPGLLRGRGGEQNGEDEPAQDTDAFTDADREEIRSRFATLKWTRVSLVSADPFRAAEVTDMAEDVIEAREGILAEQDESAGGQAFIFDPKAFQEENPDLELAAYELDEGALYSWAKKVTAIRKIIAGRADVLGEAASISSSSPLILAPIDGSLLPELHDSIPKTIDIDAPRENGFTARNKKRTLKNLTLDEKA